jgi:hypothetical protein
VSACRVRQVAPAARRSDGRRANAESRASSRKADATRRVAAERIGDQVRVTGRGAPWQSPRSRRRLSRRASHRMPEWAESGLAVATTHSSPPALGGVRSSRRVARRRRRLGVGSTSIRSPRQRSGLTARSAVRRAQRRPTRSVRSQRCAHPWGATNHPSRELRHPAAPVTDAPFVEAVRGGLRSV